MVQSAVVAALDGETAAGAAGSLELTMGALPGADALPAGVVEALADDLAVLSRTHGYAPYGLPALRAAIAERLSASGVATRAAQVLVTTGAQQAISLATGLLVRHGDPVIVENPTYAAALDVLRVAGAGLVPVPVDDDGCRADILRGLVQRAAPRAIYLCPTFHSPTGALLSEGRRRDAARIADETGVPIIEDNALEETSLGPVPPPPVAAYVKAGTVLTIGTFSKVFWSGLRVGWIRAPEPAIDRLARLKLLADYGGSLVSQALALRLLATIDEARAARRHLASERESLLRSLLAVQLSDWAVPRPAGGLLLWVRLPRGDAGQFCQLALRHGVAVVPGSVASPDDGMREFLRLPYGFGREVVEEGVRRLAAAWAAYSASLEEREAIRALV